MASGITTALNSSQTFDFTTHNARAANHVKLLVSTTMVIVLSSLCFAGRKDYLSRSGAIVSGRYAKSFSEPEFEAFHKP
jgi:hypothetical protein